MEVLMLSRHAQLRILGVALGFLGTACAQRQDTSATDTSVASSTASTSSDTSAMVRGTVSTASPTQVVVSTANGNVTVAVTPPLTVYSRQPARLADVKDNIFIGVTTVKQPDGSERATEIHIFPEELRGLGEGSRMMAPTRAGSSNRMTNGSVSGSRMTNGTASQSRMSNGSVSRASGSSLVVQYAGGSQDVTVPPNTPVTELTVASRNIAVGDQVAVLVKKAPDGSLSADKALSTAR